MPTCRKCNGTSIISRKNYSHGKKSRATISLTCRNCGSADVEVKVDKFNNKRRRR